MKSTLKLVLKPFSSFETFKLCLSLGSVLGARRLNQKASPMIAHAKVFPTWRFRGMPRRLARSASRALTGMQVIFFHVRVAVELASMCKHSQRGAIDSVGPRHPEPAWLSCDRACQNVADCAFAGQSKHDLQRYCLAALPHKAFLWHFLCRHNVRAEQGLSHLQYFDSPCFQVSMCCGSPCCRY